MRIFIITLTFFMLCCVSAGATPVSIPQEIDKEKLNATLKEIHELDQKYRYKVDSLIRAKIYTIELANAASAMNEQDAKNLERTLPIIDSIIHYNINDLDTLSYMACYLVIQHSDVEVQKKYPDFILYLYENGYISSMNYMWFIDRLNENTNKSQKYGLQAMQKNHVTILYPINDQYKKSWEELGVEFTGKAWEDLSYPPIIISDDQFAIFGFVETKSNGEGAEGVKIIIDDSNFTFTDNLGYYFFIIDKEDIPDSIQIVTDTDKFEHKIENVDDTDFIIIDHEL